ncbi:MAG: hypothetical protein LBS10_08920 [Gracilibacteraceae bacterium]|jgi:hypothetical protein|nr:hypothetical protein [Gracilibacteraceae bacterium]
MTDDIVRKGHYRKVLSGFAWESGNGEPRFFWDAMKAVTCKTRTEFTLKGLLCTPVYIREYRLTEMSDFPEVSRAFQAELRQCFSEEYFARLHWLKSLPSGITGPNYRQATTELEGRCSAAAWLLWQSLGRRWNCIAFNKEETGGH